MITSDSDFKLIAISGGIGSGKSVVSRILRIKGFSVFDCDAEAKLIMDSDTSIHYDLCSRIHPHIVEDGIINRKLLSEIVFSDAEALNTLNSIVHSSVFSLLRKKCDEAMSSGFKVMFVESAILHTSRLIEMVNEEWRVVAPVETRVKRVEKRSGLTASQIISRIEAQRKEDLVDYDRFEVPLRIINNSSEDALLPQINRILANINY